MKRIGQAGFALASALCGSLVVLAAGPARGAQSPQVPIPGAAIPQFAQPLPQLNLACVNGGAGCTAPGGIPAFLGNKALTVRMCEFQATVLPPGTFAPGVQPLTWVWGYLVDPTGTNTCSQLVDLYKNPATGAMDSYLGPVLISNRGEGSTDVTWVNDLGDVAFDGSPGTRVLAYKYSTDQTLHWADPLAQQVDGDSNECEMLVAVSGFIDPQTGLPQNFPPPGHPCSLNYGEAAPAPIAAVPHLHGGEQPAEIDGGPDAWWTSDGDHFGHKYYSFDGAGPNAALYKYPNLQEAAPLWFHDHTLGVTRLNVFAGLAGTYYVQDRALIPTAAGGTCTANCLPANLPPLSEVVPLVLQDRMFDSNGELFYTADSAGGILWATNPEHPYWSPEFIGDVNVVNGRAWPFLQVQARRYRFLLINGSDTRTYQLSLSDPVGANGPRMWVIATDGGYLDTPTSVGPSSAMSDLIIHPGERYEVIIDFASNGNRRNASTIVLGNSGRTPFPGGTPPQGSTLGRVMQFVVAPGAVVDTSYNPASGVPLRQGPNQIQRLVDPATGRLAAGVTPARTRVLTLNEVLGPPQTVPDPVTGVLTPFPGGPLEALLNNTRFNGKIDDTGLRPDFSTSVVNGTTTLASEVSREGDVEIWEFVNLTADAHPIHLHLVQFQVLNRQRLNAGRYTRVYDGAFGSGPVPLPTGCVAGVFCPGYGPPLDYAAALNPLSGGKLGGNPDPAPFLQGSVQPPLPSEAGWKDTAVTLPGMVTRFAVRWAPNSLPTSTASAGLHFPFDPTGGADEPGELGDFSYVWHCHILEHEDNEMMRPDFVTLNPAAPPRAARELVRGVDY